MANMETRGGAADQRARELIHDLRGGLTPAMLLASSLERDARLPSAARAELTVIRRTIEQQVALLERLSDTCARCRAKAGSERLRR